MIPIASWGRLDAPEHELLILNDPSRLPEIILEHQPGLPCGMLRSYGDVCLNPGGRLWLATGLNHLISFNPESGILVCESGVLLRDIQQLFEMRGWLLPVTPGTQLITVGGAIANDVHGKAHHALGTFGEHIAWLHLLRTNGELMKCSRDQNPEWFAATVGGLGLTGVIVEVALQMRKVLSPWLMAETLPFEALDDFFSLSAESGWEQSVAWIDCYSGKGERGVFMRANPAPIDQLGEFNRKRSHSIPIVPPVSLVNAISLPLFNKTYYWMQQRKRGARLVHYEPFSYPLDNLHGWNRIYGPRGFYQYQCVVPPSNGKDAIKAMLDEISRAGEGSFLAVLKTFGERPAIGMLSFPCAGITLALDFPNRGEKTLNLFSRLDTIVATAGGRLYPAKDARMSRRLFELGYPRIHEFSQYRDPGISSGLSRRLMGQ